MVFPTIEKYHLKHEIIDYRLSCMLNKAPSHNANDKLKNDRIDIDIDNS